ncbi:hypothetical protein [Parachlamydia sp. AcF125]|uniref:hypothetical protein n=1 Tax=Parachlamydia sp. AcF125 TaxID=2795736 RepID=UPI001BC97B1E|nr:hypothetical protein [Parachlamydia sp. AcF125]MBS4168152.1 hypothetical protein [Parachlamydia sp. AcF125]
MIEELQQWIEAHPADNSIQRLSTATAVNKYVKGLLDSLRRVPVTSSNIETLKKHLVLIAQQNDGVRRKLIKGISCLKAEESLRSELEVKLILTCVH